MRHLLTISVSLAVPVGSVLAQAHAQAEPAPNRGLSDERFFGSVADVQDDTSEFAGFYIQVSGLFLDPDDTSITSRDPARNSLLDGSDMTYSNGGGFIVAGGYDFSSAAESAGRDAWIAFDPRIELEGAYRFPSNNTSLIGNVEDPINDDPLLITFAVNAYLDLDIRGPVDPYIGAGVGLTYFEFGDHDHHHNHGNHHHDNTADDVVGSYQLMAGVNVHLDRNTSLYGGVRYFETDEADIDGFLFDFASTEIEFGIRIMLR